MPPDSRSLPQITWARWCFDTCVLYGCNAVTAAQITAIFARAISPEGQAIRAMADTSGTTEGPYLRSTTGAGRSGDDHA